MVSEPPTSTCGIATNFPKSLVAVGTLPTSGKTLRRPSASIRERLYVGSREQPTAGLLLSTAASDSEGTLGGLVALADARFLGRLLDQALEDAQTCSSDPLCAERVPEPPSDQLHVAACHACLFASETSCEAGNRWLHRGVMVDIAGGLHFKV